MDLNYSKNQLKKRYKINNTKGLHFDESSHTYTMDGVKLISTTTLIKEYCKPFASTFISSRVAVSNRKKELNYMIDDKVIRKVWRLRGNHASMLGTTGHDFCVMYWLDPEGTIPITNLDKNAKKLMDKVMENFDIIKMEVPQGNKRYAMGYTLDVLLRHKKTKKYCIGDFKFSKAFTTEQYKVSKNRLPNKMLGMFSGLRDVGHDKGVIQLNTYAIFIEIDDKIEISDCFLFHIDGLSPKPHYKEGYKIYRVPNIRDTVLEFLKPQLEHSIEDKTLIDKELLNKL